MFLSPSILFILSFPVNVKLACFTASSRGERGRTYSRIAFRRNDSNFHDYGNSSQRYLKVMINFIEAFACAVEHLGVT